MTKTYIFTLSPTETILSDVPKYLKIHNFTAVQKFICYSNILIIVMVTYSCSNNDPCPDMSAFLNIVGPRSDHILIQ